MIDIVGATIGRLFVWSLKNKTATTLSLRDTSPQGEACWLPSRGAVNAVN